MQWAEAFAGGDVLAAQADTLYVASRRDGTGFVFDTRAPEVFITDLEFGAAPDSIDRDPYDGRLLVTLGNDVFGWDTPDRPAVRYRWRSKLFEAPREVNFGALRVSGARAWGPDTAAPLLVPAPEEVAPPHGYPEVTVRVWADGVLRFDARCALNYTIRMPSGYKAHDWQLEIEGSYPVARIAMAETTRELDAL